VNIRGHLDKPKRILEETNPVIGPDVFFDRTPYEFLPTTAAKIT
jgi:hypothetical protein